MTATVSANSVTHCITKSHTGFQHHSLSHICHSFLTSLLLLKNQQEPQQQEYLFNLQIQILCISHQLPTIEAIGPPEIRTSRRFWGKSPAINYLCMNTNDSRGVRTDTCPSVQMNHSMVPYLVTGDHQTFYSDSISTGQ